MKFKLPDGEGYQEITLRDGDGGGVIIDIISKEDVSAILESNKKAQLGNRAFMGKGTQTSMYQLGEISALMAFELEKQGIFQDDNALRRWFRDLDNYLWRVDPYKRRGGEIAIQNTQADH